MTSFLETYGNRRMLVMLLLGFSSGLPLALTRGTLQAWMTSEGVDITLIGAFSLVGLPYTLKFLWAPLLDRFTPPFLGRRRGWIILSQFTLSICIMFLGFSDPKTSLERVAVLALVMAF